MKLRKGQFGFTIVEMLVVIFIMGILSTVVIANFKQGVKQKEILLTSDGVVQLIRLAQSYSLGGKQVSNRPTSYFQFKTSRNTKVAYVEAKLSGIATPVTVETYNFPKAVKIRNEIYGISVSCSTSCTTNPTTVYIKFVPPFGRMEVSSDGSTWSSFNYVDIQIQHDTGFVKTIHIDGLSGKIGVQ
ncbi:MAG: Tfp pilus assembly protein FimT/FimU [Acidobacteriaceae bacterium]